MSGLDPVLQDAEHLYVAVSTPSGPHVTPELFTVSGGRIVCLTASSSLKARRSRTEKLVGVAARSGSGALAAQAAVDVVDPVDPRTVAGAPAAAVASPLAIARFVVDNADELVGAAVDALSGRLGVFPERRVALVLSPVSSTRFEGDRLVWSDGWLQEDGAGLVLQARSSKEVVAIRLDALPGALAELVHEGPCVLGWTRCDGTPLALPAVWDGRSAAELPRTLVDAVGAASASPASVTFDGWTGLGPSGKQGVMLRGRGELLLRGEAVVAEVEVAKLAYWDGIETGSVTLSG